MKKFLAILLITTMTLSMVACGSANTVAKDDTTADSADSDSTEPEETEEVEIEEVEQEETKEAVKSDGYEKFSQIEMGMTEDQVNAILGEPSNIDKAYYYYNITVNGNEMEIQVWINTVSGLVTYKQGDFYSGDYRPEFADSATDFSTVNGLDDGTIATYDDCVSEFKTSGYVITEKEEGEKTYLWVDGTDGYLTVSFDADGNVKSYSGYC